MTAKEALMTTLTNILTTMKMIPACGDGGQGQANSALKYGHSKLHFSPEKIRSHLLGA